jgi:DNA mismatch repair protein MutS
MSKRFERIHNFNVLVKETAKNVLFLRKLVPGGSEHSFGIHVAKMAGMPPLVIQRAEQVLKDLENSHSEVGGKKQKVSKKQNSNGSENMQLSFFQLNDPVLEQIHDELVTIDINTLTPVEALMKLHEIKKLTGG